MQKILIIKTGGTFDQLAEAKRDFEHWTMDGMGLGEHECLIVDVQEGGQLPALTDCSGCVITGSHAMVTDGDQWITDTKAWVRHAVATGLPMLGICFGHQLMADALGGKAGYHPDGLEIGTTEITLTRDGEDDILLGHLAPSFMGHVVHSQTALTVPPDAVLIATGTHDPHQSFRVGDHAWGVQFHPEFDAEAVRHYITQLSEKIIAQGGDANGISAGVTETPESAGVLAEFARYCRKNGTSA